MTIILPQPSPFAILGAGAWGTALACHLARAASGQQTGTIRLWGRDVKQLSSMQASRVNIQHLPGHILPPTLLCTANLATALSDVQDILLTVPSSAFRTMLAALKAHLRPGMRLAWASKGLDPGNGSLLHTAAQEVLGNLPYAVLSGPSFAAEVAAGWPTAVVIASACNAFRTDLQQRFHTRTFRVYTSLDIIGAELGGAMKNVLAIGVGICEGLGFGANARSALMTRGLLEMVRLGQAVGAQPETLTGLSGMGDLVLSCTDNQSRNRRFGLLLGQGLSVESAQAEMNQLVEGLSTSRWLWQIACQHAIPMPLSEHVYRILHEGLALQVAIDQLLARKASPEQNQNAKLLDTKDIRS